MLSLDAARPGHSGLRIVRTCGPKQPWCSNEAIPKASFPTRAIELRQYNSWSVLPEPAVVLLGKKGHPSLNVRTCTSQNLCQKVQTQNIMEKFSLAFHSLMYTPNVKKKKRKETETKNRYSASAIIRQQISHCLQVFTQANECLYNGLILSSLVARLSHSPHN